MATSEAIATIAPYALLTLCSVFALLCSVPLGIGVVMIAITCLWFSRRQYSRDISNVEFHELHAVPQYTEEASALVTSEWPVPVTAEGIDEPNYVRTTSMNKSSKSLPCHLIALASSNGQKIVVAHVVLREPPSSSRDLNRFLKMLKAGLPVAAVHQAMRIAGLDPSALTDPEKFAQPAPPSGKEMGNVLISSLVVKPEFRGRGLGKGMCAYAAQVASGLGAIEAVGSCRNELVPFYEKLGAKKRTAEKREGIPKVRLGNEMFVTLDSIATNQIKTLLALTRAK